MALYTGQISGSATAGRLCFVPPGPGEVVFSNIGTVAAYVGLVNAGQTVTTTSGMPIPAGGVLPFTLFQGSPGGTFQVITGAGTAVVGFLVSTSYGLGQPGTQ